MTRLRTLLLTVALTLISLTALFAKSYDVTFDKPVKAGTVQLNAGRYTLTVNGTNAVFTDQKKNAITSPIKIENGAKKFEYTSVDLDGQNSRVRSIQLAGSTMTLQFAE